MNLGEPKSVRTIDGLSLIFNDLYVPVLTPRLNRTETSLQLSLRSVVYILLTTHFQLVPRSRKRGSIHPLLHTFSSCTCSAQLVKYRDKFIFILLLILLLYKLHFFCIFCILFLFFSRAHFVISFRTVKLSHKWTRAEFSWIIITISTYNIENILLYFYETQVHIHIITHAMKLKGKYVF
jgi:hypothetical protein